MNFDYGELVELQRAVWTRIDECKDKRKKSNNKSWWDDQISRLRKVEDKLTGMIENY